jgi:hypothetical protein
MDDEIRVYRIPIASVAPTSDVSQAEWDTLEGRVDTLETGVSMDDITDGRASGIWTPNDGDIWRYNEPAGFWEPFPLLNTIESIDDTTSVALTLTGTELTADVNFAGTGSADTAARSDHTHSAMPVSLTTGAATGVLSSGTRALRNTAGPTLASGVTYDVVGVAEVRARNNVSSGTCNLLFRVGAEGSYPQRSRNVQTVGGVPDPLIIRFHAVIAGGGSGVTEYFAVQFSSGDAVDLRDHEILIEYHPRK